MCLYNLLKGVRIVRAHMKKKVKKLKTIGQLKKQADRALQDFFRKIKTKCEICKNPYQVAHHFIKKSQSNYLRYDIKNLIFICQSCHSKFHSFSDALMTVWVYRLRGAKWMKYIEKHRHLLKKDNREELMKIIRKYGLK